MRHVVGLFCLSAAILHAQTTPPELRSWLLNKTGVTGYNGLPANVQRVQYSTNYVYVSCSGIPAYSIGPWPMNPFTPANQSYVFKVTRNPQVKTGTKTSTGLGHIGVFINGVPIFNARDAVSYNNQNIWHQNANLVEAASMDNALGHPAEQGRYHHHQNPRSLYTANASEHSPLLGYAFDGYPVYGPYAYANTDGTGGITRMRASYRLRNITQRTTLADGTVLQSSQYGPAVSSSRPLGYYCEDYEYVANLGDLDAYNGRFAVTPDYPNGSYAYYVTIDANGTSEYPYIVGPQYYGVVISENMPTGKVTITESVTDYDPTAPGNLSATIVNNSEVALIWSDNATTETGYTIERKTGSSGTWETVGSVGANITNHTDNGVTDGTQYYYRVSATFSSGSPSYSNEANVLLSMNAPTNLAAAVVSSNQITLQWQDNSGSESGYRIERKTGAAGTFLQIATVGANSTSHNDLGLSPNTQYYYRVRGYNSATTSAYSAEVSATTSQTAPATPTNLQAFPFESGQVNLIWIDNAANESGYTVERKTGANGTWAIIDSTGANAASYNNTGLADGAQYYYRVFAYNSAGNSPYSNEANGTTTMNMPTNLTATAASSSQINLSWQDNSASESGYRIERKTGTGAYAEIATVEANVTTFSNTGLSPNTQYVYRVRGYNSWVNSNYSSETTATTASGPSSVEQVSPLIPDRYSLSQNYPNPFNPATAISFQLPVAGSVTLKIYSTLGEEVATLVHGDLPPGSYEIRWNAATLPSGTYFFRLRAGEFVETKRLILLK